MYIIIIKKISTYYGLKLKLSSGIPKADFATWWLIVKLPQSNLCLPVVTLTLLISQVKQIYCILLQSKNGT